MAISFTKNIPQEHLSELQNMLQKGDEIQETLITLIEGGSGAEIFKLKTQDNSTEYKIIPILQSGVVKDTETKELYQAVIYSRSEDIYTFFDEELVDTCTALPTIVQTFYRGNAIERISNHEYIFSDSERYPAVKSKSSVERLETTLTLTDISSKGGNFPQLWDVKDEDGANYTLRERSGKIILRKDGVKDPIIQIFVGNTHPGIPLRESEVLNLLSSINEIEINIES